MYELTPVLTFKGFLLSSVLPRRPCPSSELAITWVWLTFPESMWRRLRLLCPPGFPASDSRPLRRRHLRRRLPRVTTSCRRTFPCTTQSPAMRCHSTPSYSRLIGTWSGLRPLSLRRARPLHLPSAAPSQPPSFVRPYVSSTRAFRLQRYQSPRPMSRLHHSRPSRSCRRHPSRGASLSPSPSASRPTFPSPSPSATSRQPLAQLWRSLSQRTPQRLARLTQSTRMLRPC